MPCGDDPRTLGDRALPAMNDDAHPGEGARRRDASPISAVMRIRVLIAAVLVSLAVLAPASGSELVQDAERGAAVAEGERQGRGASHVPPRGRRRSTRARLGRRQRRAPSAERPAGALPLGLRRRLGQVPQARRTGERSRTAAARTTALRSPMLVAACKAPNGSYWTVQAGSGVQPLLGFEPWLPDHTDLGAPALALLRRARRSSRSIRTGRTAARWQGVFGRLHVRGTADPRLRLEREGRAEGQVRPQPLHRHAQLGVRRRVEAGVGDPHAQGHGDVLPQLRAAQKPFAGYPTIQDVRPAATGERHRITVGGPRCDCRSCRSRFRG